MKLKNDFYDITGRTEKNGAVCFRLHLNADHPIYRAHFPDEPVTPGVCIVQMGVELLETILDKPLSLCFVKNVKFLSVISPADTPDIEFEVAKIIEEENGVVSTQMFVSSDDCIMAKLSFSCKTDD